MSLINEALRKARQEAAEREAEEKGVTYRPPRAHLPSQSKLGPGLVLGLAIGLGIAALGGAGAWMLLRSDAPEGVAETAALEAPAEPTAPVPAEPEPAASPSEPQQPAAPTETTPTETAPTETTADATAEVAAEGAAEPTSSETARVPEPSPAPEPAPSPPPPPSNETANETASESLAPTPEPPAQPLPVAVEIDPAPSTPAALPAADLPKLIEPPEQVGRQGESNVFVLEAKLGDLDLVLDFIVWSEAAPFAQINGQQVGVGQVVEGLLVEAIDREQVTLRGLDGSVILRIR